MPTVGLTTEPTASQDWTGSNTENQKGQLLTMPEAGRAYRGGIWAAGKDAAVSTRIVLWLANGTVGAQSGLFTMSGLAFALGNNINYEADYTTPIQLTNGQQVIAGYARNPTGADQHGYNSGSTHYHDTETGSWPGSLTGFALPSGTAGFYLYYDPVPEVWVRRAGAWVKVTALQVRRAGAWVDAEVWVRRAGAWVQL